MQVSTVSAVKPPVVVSSIRSVRTVPFSVSSSNAELLTSFWGSCTAKLVTVKSIPKLLDLVVPVPAIVQYRLRFTAWYRRMFA